MGAMNLSVIAFGVMAGFGILFVAAMFLMERNSGRPDFPKSDITETQDENPFKPAD
jgi:hypothetical protein